MVTAFVEPAYDAGIFLSMIIIGFACLVLYRKIGALLLVVSVMAFLIGGLLIVTGYDVSSFSQTITSSEPKGINQTSYFIGNGSFPITGVGQLWLGYGLILLSIVVGVIFPDQTLKGRLILGD